MQKMCESLNIYNIIMSTHISLHYHVPPLTFRVLLMPRPKGRLHIANIGGTEEAMSLTLSWAHAPLVSVLRFVLKFDGRKAPFFTFYNNSFRSYPHS